MQSNHNQQYVTFTLNQDLYGLAVTQAREILDHCMGELSADEQVILTLSEIEGRTSPEISQLTGKAAGTIRVILHRAKQKLADALFNLQEAYEKRT